MAVFDAVDVTSVGSFEDRVCKQVIDIDKLGEVTICHLTIEFKVLKTPFEGWIVAKGTYLSLELRGCWTFLFKDSLGWVVEMGSDNKIG